MAEAVINKGVYGDQRSAAAGQGATEAIAGVEKDIATSDAKRVARQEREYITSERKREADERVYKAEEDFYVKADIADAGLGYESGLESVFMDQKRKHAKIAGLGHKATDEQRAQLRKFTSNIQKVSSGQEYLKKLVTDYRAALVKDGGISSATDEPIAQFLKDLDTGKGEFKPVLGEDGRVRLTGKDSNGKAIGEDGKGYSYDQLQTIVFSPKYDLNKSIKNDTELLGDQVREVLSSGGGSTTYKNTPGLLKEQALDIATDKLESEHSLREIAAEMGYNANERKVIVDKIGETGFRAQVTEEYAQKLVDKKGSSITQEGNLSQSQVLAANTPKATKANPVQTVAQIDSEMQGNLETGDLPYFEALYEADNFKKISFIKDSNGKRTGIRETQTYTNDDGTTKEVISDHSLLDINARKGAVNKVLKGRGQKIKDATAPVVEGTFDKINFLENPADFIGTSVRPDGKLQRGVSDKIVKQNFNVQNVHELPVSAQQAMVARKQQEKGFDSKSALISYLDIDLPDGFDPLTASYASYPPEVRAKLKPFNAILQNLKK